MAIDVLYVCALCDVVHEQLKHLSRTIMTERERLKQALASNHSPMPANVNNYISALKASLADVSLGIEM